MIEAHRGRSAEALATVRHAERIWRRLSDDEPSVYRSELALTLNTVSLRHAELGQVSAAVTAAEESAGIFRDLVRANMVAFELDLAAVLANLSGHLWQLGRRAEAFQYNAEAEEVFDRWGGRTRRRSPAPSPPPGEHRRDAGQAVSGRPAPLGVGRAVVQQLTAPSPPPPQVRCPFTIRVCPKTPVRAPPRSRLGSGSWSAGTVRWLAVWSLNWQTATASRSPWSYRR
ncbi:tetratricopeptide repeat protein [Micromonospora sp. M12]